MLWKDRSVLVTGGSGFIGAHLVKELRKAGADVTVIDLLPDKTHTTSGTDFIEFDITSGVPEVRRRIDMIFHLAAVASPTECEKNPRKAFAVNVQGTYNMLEFAKRNNIKKFVFPSSALLYGKDPRYLPIDEKHPIFPSENVYTITKKLGEDLCQTFRDRFLINIVRLFNVFGPGQDEEYLIPTIINQAIRDHKIELWSSKPVRDFNYVQNTIEALLLIGASNNEGIYNIGSGKEIRIADISDIIAKKIGAEIKYLEKNVIGSSRLCCDNKLMYDTFGWKPRIDFIDGLHMTIDWYRARHQVRNSGLN